MPTAATEPRSSRSSLVRVAGRPPRAARDRARIRARTACGRAGRGRRIAAATPEYFLGSRRARAPTFVRGPHEKEWIDRLDARGWTTCGPRWGSRARDQGRGRSGLTLAEALEPLWIRGNRQREALRWLEPLLRARRATSTAPSARGPSSFAGRSAMEAGEAERAPSRGFAGARARARRTGDELRTAWALHGLGRLLAAKGERRTRRRGPFEESMELFLRLGEHAPAGGRMTCSRVLRGPGRGPRGSSLTARASDRAVPARRAIWPASAAASTGWATSPWSRGSSRRLCVCIARRSRSCSARVRRSIWRSCSVGWLR